MTPSLNPESELPRARRTIARRIIAGATIFAAAVIATVGVGDSDVEAARRTQSEVIAAEAEQALQALDRWTVTQNPVDYVLFVRTRDQAASSAEADIDVTSGSLQTAWSTVSIAKQEALLRAVSQLGVPYEYLASEPGVGFDCSGLTIWAFAEAGVEIPRVSRDQIRAADDVERAAAEAGDLVYYPGHISIYLGADLMVHSPNTGSHVEIVELPSKSLRFGDTAPSDLDRSDDDSLVDGALAVSQ